MTPTCLLKEKPRYDETTTKAGKGKGPMLFGELEKDEPKIKVR